LTEQHLIDIVLAAWPTGESKLTAEAIRKAVDELVGRGLVEFQGGDSGEPRLVRLTEKGKRSLEKALPSSAPEGELAGAVDRRR
jgi:DNA-binding MarR family transcriptional regulator